MPYGLSKSPAPEGWKADGSFDDRQIEDWDGSRRLVDAADPRVEIYISIVGPAAPVQESLIEDEP